MAANDRPGGSLSPLIEALYSEPFLQAAILRWEMCLHGAPWSNRRNPDGQTIKLSCNWIGRGSNITVGKAGEALNTTKCSIEFHSAERLFAKIESKNTQMERLNETPGLLFYEEADQYSESKVGSTRCVIYMGNHTVRELARLLTLDPQPNALVTLTFNAQFDADENSLRLSLHPTAYRWDGKGALAIKDVIVSVNPKVIETPEDVGISAPRS